ncbi:hypothetical protein TNCV_1854491 [Trichonephila clavipes]|nr:hypothetical protein TNCV_1854491 [Trichonephila clavipes]
MNKFGGCSRRCGTDTVLCGAGSSPRGGSKRYGFFTVPLRLHCRQRSPGPQVLRRPCTPVVLAAALSTMQHDSSLLRENTLGRVRGLPELPL